MLIMRRWQECGWCCAPLGSARWPACSGAEIPEHPVPGGADRVGVDAVGVEQEALPAGAVVPHGTPGGDGEVGPAVGDPEGPQVDVPGATAVIGEQGVRRTGV